MLVQIDENKRLAFEMAILNVLFVLFGVTAFAHDGIVEARSERVGELVNLVVSVDFDGLFGGIEDHMAFVAPMQVLIEFGLEAFSNFAVQVIGQLLQKISAFHWCPSPSRFDLK